MIRRVELDPSRVRPGSTLRPSARFEAVRDGVVVASAVLGRAEIFEREPLEPAVARLCWADGAQDAGQAVVAAAASAAGGEVYLPINAESGPEHVSRRAVAQACGFVLFQEKEGFLWSDTGQELPEPGLVLTPMARAGRAAFVPVIARCVALTLDRTDAMVVARHGPERWASTFLDHRTTGVSWLLASTGDGAPIGFVGLAAGESGVGTIVLIGVVPQRRGHRFVDRLLAAAYRVARERGFAAVLSLVDVDNRPMMAAMGRSGADAGARAWHKWLYVRCR